MDRREFLSRAAVGGLGLVAGAGGVLAAEALPAGAAVLGDDREALAAAHLGSASRSAFGARQVVWSVPGATSQVALTFDDGPDPEFTPRVLAALDRAGIHATFNVMGWNAARHPNLLREVVAAGHELANHTHSHRDLAFEPERVVREQLTRARDTVGALVGAPMRFFRPPRGEVTGCALRVAAELGHDVLLWSASRGSYLTNDVNTVTGQIAGGLRAGDVLVLHDGIGRATFDRAGPDGRRLRAQREAEVHALPEVLRRAGDRGLQFGTASALVAAAG